MKLSETERAVLRELVPGIPEGARPYAEVARRAGIAEDECLDIMRALMERGVIRRVGAIVRDAAFGYRANAMVAWRVGSDDLERAGAAAAARPEVSHAYVRRTTPAWPFNMYTMIHARTREEALAIVDELAAAMGGGAAGKLDDWRVLFTLRELTKRRPDYSDILGEHTGLKPRGGKGE